MLKYFRIFIVVVFITGCTSTHPITKTDNLPGSEFSPVGRFDKNNGRLELISSACHFSFSFVGNECKVYTFLASWQKSAYLQYEVDGQYQKRIEIKRDSILPFVIKANREGTHTVTIYKTTEAHSGPVYIDKISANSVQAMSPSNIPLIEFIGNSITCGAAADASVVPCGTGDYHDQHDAYYAYGPRVARGLGVDFILSSVSGIGIYRNWNSDGPTMPQVYEKTDFSSNNRIWDFSKYHPHIVSIALGTNDFSDGDGKTPRLPFNKDEFVKKYIEFVKLVKSKYPSSKIILLSSPMINGEKRTVFQSCLNAVKENIDKQYPYDFPITIHFSTQMNPRGCTGHPNVEDHEIIAKELIPVFKSLLTN